MLFVDQRGRDSKVNTEPVCRPTRAKGLTDLSVGKVMRGCVFEGGTREVWRRVDFELDVRMTRGTLGFDLTVVMLVSLYDK